VHDQKPLAPKEAAIVLPHVLTSTSHYDFPHTYQRINKYRRVQGKLIRKITALIRLDCTIGQGQNIPGLLSHILSWSPFSKQIKI
jgi:hypothetical protein